jgi:hypothetical protein
MVFILIFKHATKHNGITLWKVLLYGIIMSPGYSHLVSYCVDSCSPSPFPFRFWTIYSFERLETAEFWATFLYCNCTVLPVVWNSVQHSSMWFIEVGGVFAAEQNTNAWRVRCANLLICHRNREVVTGACFLAPPLWKCSLQCIWEESYCIYALCSLAFFSVASLWRYRGDRINRNNILHVGGKKFAFQMTWVQPSSPWLATSPYATGETFCM